MRDRHEPATRAAVVALFVLAVVALALFSASATAEPEREPVAVPVDCGEAVCVLPKRVWGAVLEAHNAAVDENRRLKALLAEKSRRCAGTKT